MIQRQNSTSDSETRRSPPRRARSSAGFTLLEIMLVMSIMIALSAVLIPSVGQLIARQDMDVVEEELMSAIDLAHSQAIASGAPYTVTVSPLGAQLNGQVVVREGDPGQTCSQVAAQGRVVRRILMVSDPASVDGTSSQGTVTPRVLQSEVRVVAVVPQEFGNGRALCFKGDGSMRDSETNTPVPNPDELAPATGDVVIQFQQYQGTSPVGVLNHIVVSYNGVARAKY